MILGSVAILNPTYQWSWEWPFLTQCRLSWWPHTRTLQHPSPAGCTCVTHRQACNAPSLWGAELPHSCATRTWVRGTPLTYRWCSHCPPRRSSECGAQASRWVTLWQVWHINVTQVWHNVTTVYIRTPNNNTIINWAKKHPVKYYGVWKCTVTMWGHS